jgi:hypothetical protein
LSSNAFTSGFYKRRAVAPGCSVSTFTPFDHYEQCGETDQRINVVAAESAEQHIGDRKMMVFMVMAGSGYFYLS